MEWRTKKAKDLADWANGEAEQAKTYYKRIVDGVNPTLKDAALFNLGRLHEKLGETTPQDRSGRVMDW